MRVLKIDGVLTRKLLDHFGRIEKPPPIVLPIIHVIGKIVVHTSVTLTKYTSTTCGALKHSGISAILFAM
jgi:hypothetical protein